MKLKEDSIRWAIKHLQKESDTDLFPKPIEIEIVNQMVDEVVRELIDLDITNYHWNSSRRFVIPKSELSYRVSTQLDLIDSIIISAIIHEYGALIESRRDDKKKKRVFSYRFAPCTQGKLYESNDSWKGFWNVSFAKSKLHKYVVYIDIADFYNQIYHHVVENQLIACGFPNQIKKTIIGLLEELTQGVSRGIPIGPHFAHLLAEMTLIPVDESFKLRKYDFCRYSDDILIFCNTENEARKIVYEVATILDKQQRLIMQKQKTEIFMNSEFENRYRRMLNDDPIDNNEKEILDILNEKSSGNPYARVDLSNLTEIEKSKFSKQNLTNIINTYLSNSSANYSRLRWFYRRLVQVGTDNAIQVSIDNFEKLIPAISDVCHYFISAVDCCSSQEFHITGEKLLKLLDNEIVSINEFFQISILSLFVNNNKLNNIDKLIELYYKVPEGLKRKIILACYAAKGDTWLRELKEEEHKMELWNKRAYLIACSILPSDEKDFYLKRIKAKLSKSDIMTKIIINWSLKQ